MHPQSSFRSHEMKNLPLTTPIHIEGSLGTGCHAIFLDRDGVINQDHGYVGTWDRFDFVRGALEGIKVLNGLGYRVIVVTNQSGIGRGLYTQDMFVELTQRMLDEIADYGARIDAVYACPHFGIHEKNDCDCRKPKPGMVLAALAKYNLLAERSFLVGDKVSDISAAKSAGVYQTALLTNSSKDPQNPNVEARWYVRNLIEFAQIIQQVNDIEVSHKDKL
jgi:D-glycero-D-manno-heptose 1,7-bisphosphate phosphatase